MPKTCIRRRGGNCGFLSPILLGRNKSAARSSNLGSAIKIGKHDKEHDTMAGKGNLFIISSPSGAGKSTLISMLFERLGKEIPMAFSVSHTTRAPRPGEIDGVHYHFTDIPGFKKIIDEGGFFEWANVFGNYYGTSKAGVEGQLESGTDVFLDIDWQGARQIREQVPSVRTVFIVPPSLDVLRNRLVGRGQDSMEVIENRMQKAKNEISHYGEYDYLIVNDDLETAYETFAAIIRAERASMACQKFWSGELVENMLNG